MSFISVAAGQRIRATHTNQFSSWLTGGKLDSPGTIAATSAADYTLVLWAQETTAGLISKMQYGASGTPTTVMLVRKTDVTVNVPHLVSLSTAPAAGIGNITGGSTSVPITLASRYGGSERYGALNVELFSNAASGAVEYGAITGRNFVHAGTAGHHAGLWGFAAATGTFVGSGDHSASGVIGIGETSRDDVTVRGANFIARNVTGIAYATGGLLAGVEINLSNYATSTTVSRRGLSIGFTGGSGAYIGSDAEQDVHIALTNKIPATGSLIGLGFLAPSHASGATSGVLFPVRTEGSLIWASSVNRNASGPNVVVRYGINFTDMSFAHTGSATAGYAFIANGFSVDGSGGVFATSVGSLDSAVATVMRIAGANRWTFGTDGGFWANSPSASPGLGLSETGGTVRYVLAMNTSNRVLLGHTANALTFVATTMGMFGSNGTTVQAVSTAATNSATTLLVVNEIRSALLRYGALSGTP